MTSMVASYPSNADEHAGRSSVKAGLTPKRPRRQVENDEYGAFVRRVLRGYSRRVADGDVEALILMTGLADELDAAIAEAVKGLRGCGYSWARDRLPARHHPAGRPPTVRLVQVAGFGSHSESHADEHPWDAPNSPGQREEASPRSRTGLNSPGRQYGHLRI